MPWCALQRTCILKVCPAALSTGAAHMQRPSMARPSPSLAWGAGEGAQCWEPDLGNGARWVPSSTWPRPGLDLALPHATPRHATPCCELCRAGCSRVDNLHVQGAPVLHPLARPAPLVVYSQHTLSLHAGRLPPPLWICAPLCAGLCPPVWACAPLCAGLCPPCVQACAPPVCRPVLAWCMLLCGLLMPRVSYALSQHTVWPCTYALPVCPACMPACPMSRMSYEPHVL